MNATVPKLRPAAALLFAAELAAIAVLLMRYDGAMSVGFLLALPLLGLLQSLRPRRTDGGVRDKLFVAMQALLLLLPPLLFYAFQPNVSREQAVALVRSIHTEAASIVNENEKSFVAMDGLTNPFISKGYKIVVSENGALTEYAVNPVTGKVSELR
ncbi:hypothetical protein [Paenibacillus sp. GYB003]|uniref:hypothetical protein n=1 Tax=Paenibacillus sp. GYB003 TaxID=2994392 RepID=UPI002F96360F